jgi:hypothetical protein
LTSDGDGIMKRYGKASGPLLELKRSFFEENDRHLHDNLAIGRLYAAQPPRVACKNCEQPLGAADFVKQEVAYVLCRRCGHLNGCYEDTEEFCRAVYTERGGDDYARTYASASGADYAQRLDAIYRPKAEFLFDALRERGLDPGSLSYVDLGAGSGYLVAALKQLGARNAIGYEPSEAQVRHANAMNGTEIVRQLGLDDGVALARSVEADVVALIGVLEHVQRPRELLRALHENARVRWLFVSVPLFSPSVFFEMVFPTVMHRQLTAAHTHLYTDSSITWLCDEFHFVRRAEWWFGTDIVDLYRSVGVRLAQLPETSAMVGAWSDLMKANIDSLQLDLDRRQLSSEVHLLLEVAR